MNISLIIPAYNEERYIGPCLEAIALHRATPEGAAILEVIVINNASTARTAARVSGSKSAITRTAAPGRSRSANSRIFAAR